MNGPSNILSAVLPVVSFCMVAWAAERSIDVHNSTIRIHVGKAGLFSPAGHEHWVSAPLTPATLMTLAVPCHNPSRTRERIGSQIAWPEWMLTWR